MPCDSHRAKLDGNRDLAQFAATLERVCVDTVEAGFMTKDLALLVGVEQKWLSTTGFLDKVDENLRKAMVDADNDKLRKLRDTPIQVRNVGGPQDADFASIIKHLEPLLVHSSDR